MFHRLRQSLVPVLLATASTPAAANDTQLWFNTTFFGSVENLAFYSEVQPRFGNGISQLDQFFFRPAIGWKINENLTLYQGYAYVEDRGGSQVNVEDRSFQEINWKMGEFNGIKTSSRTRFEQRWRSDGKDVGFRLRSQLRLSAPLGERAKSVSALGWSEVFVALNDADWGPRSGFDQVRTFAGLEIPVEGQSTVEIGYLNRLLKAPAGDIAVDHVLSINLFIRK